MTLEPVNVTCKCRVPRRPPLRIESHCAAIIRDRTDGVDPNQIIATWRCGNCKQKIPVRLKDLYLAST